MRERIEVRQPPEAAFEALADFSTSVEWDPGVARATRVRDGADSPSGVGAEYELTVVFRGRSSEMRYSTTTYEPPRRVVLEGTGPQIQATDTIELAPLPSGGTLITYTADLRLTGVAKLAQPLLGGAFTEMGRRALAGMHAWFERSGTRPDARA